MWWHHVSIYNPAFWKQRQEDCYKLEASQPGLHKLANDYQIIQEKKKKEEGGRGETIQTAQDALLPVTSQTRGHDGIMLGQTGHLEAKPHKIYVTFTGYPEQSRQ